ncbi:unnamed protein product [Adineta steineri]|uniref:Uncharacterized protein n=1 Tax=Adineta steineri TaxID=433720 RepID=A0A813R4S4_9BILA|nr:unnamed protein product [Adineta steineri]
MQTRTMLIVGFIWILASISYCSGDTCYCRCCAGNFCTPTLQGTIIIPSCGSSCKSQCQSKYPTQCTSGSGSANYQCTSGGGGGGSETPNWTGTFVVQNRCDKISCCCPANEIILSSASANTLRIQSRFTCFDATFWLNDTIQTPSGFSTTLLLAGDPIHTTISQDSRTIQLNNAVSPECSEVAVRNGPLSSSTTGTKGGSDEMHSFIVKIIHQEYTTDGIQMDLNFTKLKDNDWPIVLEQIQNKDYPLRGLSLSWDTTSNKMIEPGFIQFIKIIENHTTLIHFKIRLYSISDNTKTNFLLGALKKNRSIKNLSVNATDVNQQTTKAFSEVLKDNQSILSLDFYNCNYADPREPAYPMFDDCATNLSHSFTTSALQRLKIGDIDDRTFKILLPSLVKTLHVLDLSGNTNYTPNISAFQSHLQSNDNTLRVLILNSSGFEKFKQSELSSKIHIVNHDSFLGNLFSLEGPISITPHIMNKTDWSILLMELTKDINSLREVDLNLSDGCDENSMNYLENLLGAQSQLKKLKISGTSLNQSIQEKLFQILRKNTSIIKFEMNTKIELNILKYLIDFLAKNNNIAHLKFDECANLGDQEAIALADALKMATNLKSFQVNSSDIGNSGFQAILSSLPDSLILLHFTHSCLNAKILPWFGNFIKTHPKIRDISLANNPITLNSAPELDVAGLIDQILKITNANQCNCYLEIYTKIQDIISDTPIGCIWLPREYRRDYDLLELYNEMKKNPTKYWSINMKTNSNMSLHAYDIFLDILNCDIRVAQLYLGEDDMNEEVQKYFFKDFRDNNTVEHLEISQNKLCSQAMKYIGSFLKHSSKICIFKLRKCQIDSEGIRYLCKGLSESRLYKLSLNENPLDDDSCARILSSIPPSLKSLSLVFDEISESSLQTIIDFLNTNKTLETLNLMYNPVYDNRVDQLKRVARQNDICKFSTDIE